MGLYLRPLRRLMGSGCIGTAVVSGDGTVAGAVTGAGGLSGPAELSELGLLELPSEGLDELGGAGRLLSLRAPLLSLTGEGEGGDGSSAAGAGKGGRASSSASSSSSYQ